jgi:nitrite reductase/ring-hydroxylating ferredoxin subunit
MSDDPIPVVGFPDFVIPLSAPEYLPLMVNGGYKEINSIGVRGVIVYREDALTYLAYERNCSFRPNEACATINVHSSGLYMLDPCCNSSFSFTNGAPTGGVASRPLRQYVTELVGTQLTIKDEILN